MNAQQIRQLEDEAAQWIAHLANDTAPAASFDKFALWLDQSPAHKVAFDEMIDLWADMGLSCRFDQKITKKAV